MRSASFVSGLQVDFLSIPCLSRFSHDCSGFAILFFVSFVQSLSQVTILPKHTNSRTFSTSTWPRCSLCWLSCCPYTMVLVLPTLAFNPTLSPGLLTSTKSDCRLSLSLFKRSTSSVKLMFLTHWPRTDIPDSCGSRVFTG